MREYLFSFACLKYYYLILFIKCIKSNIKMTENQNVYIEVVAQWHKRVTVLMTGLGVDSYSGELII